jgi:hypothetical protein
MEVSGQLHAPTVLPSGEEPLISIGILLKELGKWKNNQDGCL